MHMIAVEINGQCDNAACFQGKSSVRTSCRATICPEPLTRSDTFLVYFDFYVCVLKHIYRTFFVCIESFLCPAVVV